MTATVVATATISIDPENLSRTMVSFASRCVYGSAQEPKLHSNARDLLPQQSRLAAVVILDPALTVENKCCPVDGRVGRPMRDRRIVGFPPACERRPGRGDPSRESVGNLAAVGLAAGVDGLEHERHVERMEGLELATQHRRFPVERVEPD